MLESCCLCLFPHKLHTLVGPSEDELSADEQPWVDPRLKELMKGELKALWDDGKYLELADMIEGWRPHIEKWEVDTTVRRTPRRTWKQARAEAMHASAVANAALEASRLRSMTKKQKEDAWRAFRLSQQKYFTPY